MPWRGRRTATAQVAEPHKRSFGFGSLVSWLGVGASNYSGATVTETSALAVSAVWRAVALISDTIASLPTRVVSVGPDGVPVQRPSFLESPGGRYGPTRFEFWQTTLLHLLLHGNAYLIIRRDGFGGVVELQQVHPDLVVPELERDVSGVLTGHKTFRITLADGRNLTLSDDDVLHIPGMSSDGLVGYSPLAIARNSIGTTIAADRSAAKQFGSGGMVSMIATPEDDLDPEEADDIKRALTRSVSGFENASEVAVINRRLKLTPWTLSAADSQFLESRAFQVEEISRWFGVPPFALMQTDKQTSWGTGIESQQRGLAKTVLRPWTERIAQRVNRLLADDEEMLFDFSALEKADPVSETNQLIAEVNAGLLTPNEARARRGLAPLAGGDTPRIPVAVAQPADMVGQNGGDE